MLNTITSSQAEKKCLKQTSSITGGNRNQPHVISNRNCQLTLKKTVCMVFKPRNRDRMITDCFPSFTLNGCALAFVSQFKYLEHIINNTWNDDDDIKQEIKNLFMLLIC